MPTWTWFYTQQLPFRFRINYRFQGGLTHLGQADSDMTVVNKGDFNYDSRRFDQFTGCLDTDCGSN